MTKFDFYTLCGKYLIDVNIALENKRTILSATLGVKSAKKGLSGSFNNILPNITFIRTGCRHFLTPSTINVLYGFSLTTTPYKIY